MVTVLLVQVLKIMLKHSNMHNESFSKDCIPLFEFYYNKINLLKSETNADKHCRLRSQEEYDKLLSDLKEIGCLVRDKK